MQSFDDIYILDLHGSAKKNETAPDGSKDENVFDIQQGVSIALMVKTGKKPNGAPAIIWHNELFGKREYKYNSLNISSISDIKTVLKPSQPHYAWVISDESLQAQYQLGFKVTEIMPTNVLGFQTHRDGFAIDFNRKVIIDRMEDMRDKNIVDSALSEKYMLTDNRDWQVLNARKRIQGNINWQNFVTECAYRPFDSRWCYFDEATMDYPRRELKNHVLAKNNVCLGVGRQGLAVNDPSWSLVTVSEKPVDANIFRRGGINVFPLYLYPDATDLLAETNRTPNFDMQIVDAIAVGLQLKFTPEKTELTNTLAPIDLLDYIYAILHSPSYRETYKEFLKIDFPRVPYPSDVTQFWQLVALGDELRKLHLLEGDAINKLITSYPQSGNSLVDKPHYDNSKVYINDTQYFDGVPQLAWEFYLGGYQPAQKWLKDRKGRVLGYEDILHYQKIIKVLVETDKLMQDIDNIGVI